MFDNLYSQIESPGEVVTVLDLRVQNGLISVEELESRSKAYLEL